MSRLIDSLRASRALPTPEDTGAFNWFQQTWQQDGVEPIQATFESYARDGYQGNGVVHAVLNARLTYFSQATFKYRNLGNGSLFGGPSLSILEQPWPGGGTGELLARMIQDVDLAGNAFVRRASATQLERLRPDWVDILTVEYEDGTESVAGYVYYRDGRGKSGPDDIVLYTVDEVVHWSPYPDPLACWRGMSPLTAVSREVNSDTAMTVHKQSFLDNAATPNLVIRYATKLAPEQVALLRDRWQSRYGGAQNAWKTAILDEGADLSVVGQGLEQMSFTAVQAAGENRIAAAFGVPGIIVGLKEGLDAATYSNFAQAMRRFADGTLEFLWLSACRALSKLVQVPSGAELYFDRARITALREGEQERAVTAQTLAAAAMNLINAGYVPDTVTSALTAGDLSLLKHTGAIPTALYPDGKAPIATGRAADMAVTLPAADPQHITVNLAERAAPVVHVNVEPTPVSPTPVQVNVPRADTPTITVNVEPTPVNVNVEPSPVAVSVDPSPVVVNLPADKPTKTVTVVERDPRTGLISKTTATEKDV